MERPTERTGLGGGDGLHDLALSPRTAPAPLTIMEAGDAQGLGSVQREAALCVLEAGHDRHGVEVGLQGQLLPIPPGLHLRGQGQQIKRIRAPFGPRSVLPPIPPALSEQITCQGL